MATTTTNYALTKPAPADPALISDINTNMDTVDGQLTRFGFKGTDIVCAATITLPAVGSVFDVTGSTGPVTALSSRPAGEVVILQFDATPTLTHHATNLVLGGGVNYPLVAGDVIVFASDGGGAWREVARRDRYTPYALLTTTGDTLYASAANTPARLAAGAAFQVYRMNAGATAPVWSNDVLRVGSDTTERSTTSTSTVDLSTITVAPATALAVGVPFVVVVSWRKTAGAAAVANLGLKLNATQVRSNTTASTATNQAESGYYRVHIGGHPTSYGRAGWADVVSSGGGVATPVALDGDIPTANITTVVITGQVSSASITLAIDEVHVYAYPVA